MKKLFITLLILLTASICQAAGTVTGSSALFGGGDMMRVTYTVTFDASAGSPANVALDSITATTGKTMRSLSGWILLRVDTYPGTTAPTADTDFYLWLIEDKIDILGNNGFNAIDGAATYNSFYPATASQPLSGAEIFDIDNNAVNSAGCIIIFTLYR